VSERNDSPSKAKGHFLEITLDKKNNTVNITGNDSGLKYLSEVCALLIKKNKPEHWHLSYEFYTLSQGSIETVIFKK
jgi:hypothetical protein